MSYNPPKEVLNGWKSHKNVKSHNPVTFSFREMDTMAIYKNSPKGVTKTGDPILRIFNNWSETPAGWKASGP